MGQILAIVSSKGGVGKTTTAVNLAAAFASLDFPTLLVEADPQCGLVANFGFDRYSIPKGLAEVARGEARLEETTFETPVAGLHVVSSNIWTQEEEAQYLSALDRDPLILRRAAAFLKDGYDYIIIDAPPMLGPITMAVLAAADRFVVPLSTEPHAIRSLSRLMEAANLVRSRHNPDLKFDGVALTMVDTRTRVSTETANMVRTVYKDQVFSTMIPRSVRLAEVPATGRPIAVSDPSSRGGRSYMSLAEEILLGHARERAIERTDIDDEALEEAIEIDAEDVLSTESGPSIHRIEEGQSGERAVAVVESSGVKSGTAVAGDENWQDGWDR